jgi:hypothetical protein
LADKTMFLLRIAIAETHRAQIWRASSMVMALARR